MIERADFVVIASDINVEMDRFSNKKVYITNTNEAINSPLKVLEKTINASQSTNSNNSGSDTFSTKPNTGKFMRHFLNGVSHMIPFIVFSGILYAILNAIAVGMKFTDTDTSTEPMHYLLQAANIGFSLFTGIMGGYIAVSIAGRAALAPGLIATIAAASPKLYINYNIS
jgi:PTS system fructose-specific IIC component